MNFIQRHSLETSVEDLRGVAEALPDRRRGRSTRAMGPGSIRPPPRLSYGGVCPVPTGDRPSGFEWWLENALALGRLGDVPCDSITVGSGGRRRWRGRGTELARIDACSSARRGESSVLVVRGEGGVVRRHARRRGQRARGLRILRARGEDPDGDDPFAARRALLAGLHGACRRRAPPRTADPRTSRSTATSADDAAGALDLLVRTAETPLLVLVDEAHLLDDASF